MWSIYTWIRDLISDYTWFWWSSNGSKSNTILLVGLDDAGKTTLTGLLTQNRLIQSHPTGQPTTHDIKIGTTRLAITDVGGHQLARRLWREYMFAATRLVFIIDASNRERLLEARYELMKIVNDDEMKNVPLLILANKIDNTRTACSESEMRCILGIEKYLNSENPQMKLCMCSFIRNEGFTDGLKWLVNQQIKSDD